MRRLRKHRSGFAACDDRQVMAGCTFAVHGDRPSRFMFTVAACFLSFLVNTAVAQKAPELGYVFPPVVQAGAETSVQLGGYDFTPDMQFFVHDDRVTVSILGPPGDFLVPKPPYWFGEKGFQAAFPIAREIPARILVPANHPAGPVRWQVANANGSSTTAVFYVSDGPETVEARDRGQPQSLQRLPIGVSGRLERIAEVDRYHVTAVHDGPVSLELFARRLGANFNGMIQVRDIDDRLLADAADTEGVDTALTFSAKAGQTYTISLHDVDFRGNEAFVYRLVVAPGPRVITTVPAVAQRGETREVEFIGYGVASGAVVLESTKRTVEFPADPQQSMLRYQLQTPHGTALPIDIPVRDASVSTAAESSSGTNATAASATLLTVPCDLTAVLGPRGEETYSWQANAGDVWRIAAESRAIGTDLDLALSIRDADGTQLATNDDLPGTPDTGLDFTVPADGLYACVVRDLSGRSSGRSSVYHLSITKSQTAFSLSTPQQVNIPAGDKAELSVTAARSGGHSEEIELEISGLPEGITALGELKIPGDKSELKIPLECATNTAATASLIYVTGKSRVDEEYVTVVATCSASGNLCPRHPLENQVSRTLLATTLKPIYTVELIDRNRQRAVHRGTTYPAPFIIKRDEGFAGEVVLQMAARQSRHRQGIHGPILAVPPEADRALYPCFMPEWLATDKTTRMVVLGMARQRDPAGNLRYVTQPADARITMILEGALLKVSHAANELTASIGDEFEIPFSISRSAKLRTPVSVQLHVPDELAGLIQCVPAGLTLSTEENHGVLKVQTASASRLLGRWNLQIKAIAVQDGKWPVISQAEATIEFVGDTNERISANTN
jgi:hypothetical protein